MVIDGIWMGRVRRTNTNTQTKVQRNIDTGKQTHTNLRRQIEIDKPTYRDR